MQVLSRAAELLGLVPVFPVRNASTFSSGSGTGGAVFRDCVLMKKYVLTPSMPLHSTSFDIIPATFQAYTCISRRRSSTVGDVFRKIMGDVPLAFVETAGGIRVAEDDIVAVGKNDVSPLAIA